MSVGATAADDDEIVFAQIYWAGVGLVAAMSPTLVACGRRIITNALAPFFDSVSCEASHPAACVDDFDVDTVPFLLTSAYRPGGPVGSAHGLAATAVGDGLQGLFARAFGTGMAGGTEMVACLASLATLPPAFDALVYGTQTSCCRFFFFVLFFFVCLFCFFFGGVLFVMGFYFYLFIPPLLASCGARRRHTAQRVGRGQLLCPGQRGVRRGGGGAGATAVDSLDGASDAGRVRRRLSRL